MTWASLGIQALGFIGVLFFLISYQVRANRWLFLLQTLGCLTFCIQFALLGGYNHFHPALRLGRFK